jgi:hypothetical protein
MIRGPTLLSPSIYAFMKYDIHPPHQIIYLVLDLLDRRSDCSNIASAEGWGIIDNDTSSFPYDLSDITSALISKRET